MKIILAASVEPQELSQQSCALRLLGHPWLHLGRPEPGIQYKAPLCAFRTNSVATYAAERSIAPLLLLLLSI